MCKASMKRDASMTPLLIISQSSTEFYVVLFMTDSACQAGESEIFLILWSAARGYSIAVLGHDLL